MGRLAVHLSSRAFRWMLPVVLTLGICGMHTLGHVNPGHGQAAASPAPAMIAMRQAQASEDGSQGKLPPEPVAPASVFKAALFFSSGTGLPHGFDPTSVCLAVLASLLLLLLAVAWAGSRRWPGGPSARADRSGEVARPPPRRLAPSLARLSVMRV
jgi:hypothetical protein